MLLIFANPSNTHPLRLHSEEKAIRDSVHRGQYGDRIHIDVLPACTIEDLIRQLNSHHYDLIHFSGHADRSSQLVKHTAEQVNRLERGANAGFNLINDKAELQTLERDVLLTVSQLETNIMVDLEESGVSSGIVHLAIGPMDRIAEKRRLLRKDLHVCTAYSSGSYSKHYTAGELYDIGVGSLAFENEVGKASLISPSVFASLIKSHSPPLQCVILNACSSHIQGSLLSHSVPYTICFGARISDSESIMFSRGFYESIGEGKSIESACVLGTRRIDVHSLSPGMPPKGSRDEADVNYRPPLVSFFKNRELIAEHLRFNHETLTIGGMSEADKWREENEKLRHENASLRQLVSYGMELLQTKDSQLNELRYKLHSNVNNGFSTPSKQEKLQNSRRPGSARQPARSVRSNNSSFSGSNSSASKKSGTAARRINRTPEGVAFGRTTSSAPKINRVPASVLSRPRSSNNNDKSLLNNLKQNNVVEQEVKVSKISMTRLPDDQVKKEVPSPVRKSLGDVPSPSRKKNSTSRQSLIPVGKGARKEKGGWVKEYPVHVNAGTSLLDRGIDTKTYDELTPPAVNVAVNGRSSAGFREFLKQQRDIVSQLKPTSSFASSVPRFETKTEE